MKVEGLEKLRYCVSIDEEDFISRVNFYIAWNNRPEKTIRDISIERDFTVKSVVNLMAVCGIVKPTFREFDAFINLKLV